MQIEVPQIDPTLWRRLNIEAKHRGITVSDLLQNAIHHYLEIKPSQTIVSGSSNLRRLAGTWTEEEAEEFERNTAYFSQIDHDIWT
jgi:hypothetical protein